MALPGRGRAFSGFYGLGVQFYGLSLDQQKDLGDLINLQGHLKEKFPETGIIRTIPIPQRGLEADDFPFLEIARALEPVSDLFLIDTWVEKDPVEGFIGITGRQIASVADQCFKCGDLGFFYGIDSDHDGAERTFLG